MFNLNENFTAFIKLKVKKVFYFILNPVFKILLIKFFIGTSKNSNYLTWYFLFFNVNCFYFLYKLEQMIITINLVNLKNIE